ncbi:hypothetical protein GQ53DRAFT_372788 [Thozetella sp. PMI_491]|nr:hypothetical protein GQ53DRAFT_372788 [Thozetella sp. PMI_491]
MTVTMDNYRDRSWASSPQSGAPLALQDFMSQNALTASTHEGTLSRLDTPAAEPKGQSSAHTVGESPSKPAPLTSEIAIEPDDLDDLERDPEQDVQEVGEEEEQDAPVDDWKAVRVQLPQGKKAGKKTEWIRGWSAEISAQGDEVYCACSGPSAETTSLTPTTAITSSSNKSRTGSAASQPAPPPASPGRVCHHCSRLSSPALKPALGDEDPFASRNKGLRKKMSGLVMRVIKGRKLASPSPLSLKGGALAQNAEPKTNPKSPANNADLVDPDDLTSSDEGSARGRQGLKERQERLARAQELLDRQRQ